MLAAMADDTDQFGRDLESTAGGSDKHGPLHISDDSHLATSQPFESEGPWQWRHRVSFISLIKLVSRRVQNSHIRTKLRRRICQLVILYLSLVGLVHVVSDILQTRFPDDADSALHQWVNLAATTIGVGQWLSDATRDAHPVGCHSHNDYWRTTPLFDAIAAGCPSVEADVWYQDDDLFVGHRQFQLEANRTLQSLYIDPLIDLLERQNNFFTCGLGQECDSLSPSDQPLAGVFTAEPDQQLVLLVDFKVPGQSIWRELQTQLKPLRDRHLLTYFNGTAIVPGPVIVVASGQAPFADLTANEAYRDVFYDAPLALLADTSAIWPNPNRAPAGTPGAQNGANDSVLHPSQLASITDTKTSHGYGPSNSYYASASFKQAVGQVWGSRLTQEQLQRIRSQVRGAHQLGLKVRYWGVPAWPIGLRNHIWHILIREGVDMLNVDNLRQATTWDWRRKKGLLF